MHLRSKRLISWVAGLALVGGLSVYPLTSRTARADEHEHDHNPRIHRALDALRDAHKELDEAPHDFHGHKKEALEAVDKAIEHLDELKDW